MNGSEVVGRLDTDGIERRQFIRTAGAAGVVALAGCGGDTGGANTTDGSGGTTTTTTARTAAEPITFGQPAIKTGGIAFIQPPVSASSDIARRMVNEAGGPLDREVEIVRRNTAYKPSTAKQAVKDLVNVDDAVVVNGLTSTTAVPNWEFIKQLGLPVVSMYAGTRFFDTRGGDNGTPQKTGDDGWFWRTTGADSQHTAAAALHAKDVGASRIGIINTKTSGAQTWAKAFSDAVEVIPAIEQTNRVEVEGGNDSYTSALDSLFSADVDLFAMAIEEAPDAVTLFEDWKQGGYGGKVMLSNPMKNSEIRQKLGSRMDDGDWVRVSVPAIAGPYSQTYLETFSSFVEQSDDYEDSLTVNNWSASAYDAITVSALAIERAGTTDPKAIQRNLGPVARRPGTEVTTFKEGKEALRRGEDINFAGAQTEMNFTDNGDVFNAARIWELDGSQWTEVDLIEGPNIQQVVLDIVTQQSGSDGS